MLDLHPSETIERSFSVSNRLLILMVISGVVIGVALPFLFRMVGDAVFFDGQMGFQIGLVLGLIIAGYTILRALYLRLARQYFLTNERVIALFGFLARRSIYIQYDDITDLSVKQDAFERFILGTGDIYVNTAGTATEELELQRVADPYGLADLIREQCMRHRRGATAAAAAPVAPAVPAPVTIRTRP